MKRISIFSGIIMSIGFLFLLNWCFSPRIDNTNTTPMEVVFFSFESEGESILISQGNQNILIDTGTKEESKKILDYLSQNEIGEIEYLVLTHPMDGNIGGALDILEQITVKAVIQPYCGGMENMTAIEINNYLKEKNIQNIIPTRNRKFVLGNLNLVVYSPLKKTYTDVRNYSLATFVSFNKINMLFSANANKRRNEELLAVHWPKIDLYKIPNYGKENKTGINLIQELAPQTAVSTADTLDKGVENALLKTETIVYYVTEENISFSSDGESIKCINGKEELNGK